MNAFEGKIDIDYLQKAATFFAPIKQRSFLLMQVSQNDCVMDVGCGPGIDALELGKLVTPGGCVFGVDNDQVMLDQAIIKAQAQNLDNFIHFQQADVCNLPFESNFFHSCRSERLFMHLPAPDQALAEIVRVTKPGGRVVIVETDWASLSIDGVSPHIEQKFSIYRTEKVFANGYSGRSLYRLFKQHHFKNIKIELFPLCVTDINLFYALTLQQSVEEQALIDRAVSEQDLQQWREQIRQTGANDTFYCSITIVMIMGEIST